MLDTQAAATFFSGLSSAEQLQFLVEDGRLVSVNRAVFGNCVGERPVGERGAKDARA